MALGLLEQQPQLPLALTHPLPKQKRIGDTKKGRKGVRRQLYMSPLSRHYAGPCQAPGLVQAPVKCTFERQSLLQPLSKPLSKPPI